MKIGEYLKSRQLMITTMTFVIALFTSTSLAFAGTSKPAKQTKAQTVSKRDTKLRKKTTVAVDFTSGEPTPSEVEPLKTSIRASQATLKKQKSRTEIENKMVTRQPERGIASTPIAVHSDVDSTIFVVETELVPEKRSLASIERKKKPRSMNQLFRSFKHQAESEVDGEY